MPPRVLHRGNVWEHSPTRKKKIERVSLNWGWFNAIALPPQSYYHGPLTRGPSNCQPFLRPMAPLTGVRVDSRGPRHMSAPRVPHAGLARLCHLALRAATHPHRSRVPRQLCPTSASVPRQHRGVCGIKTPPFL